MLEERLSKAYNQQNLGYNLPAPRQHTGGYPSMGMNGQASAPAAESFYTGQQSQPYPIAPGGAQFAPQGAGQPGAPPFPPGQDPAGHYRPQSVASQQGAPTPSVDQHQQYYFNQQGTPAPNPGQPSAPAPDANPSPYPTLQQSPQYHRGSVSSQTAAAPQAAPAPSQPLQQPPPQQPPQQSYWQPSMSHQHAQQPPAGQNWQYGGYNQDSFPSVPQAEPVKKPVQEEALIEL